MIRRTSDRISSDVWGRPPCRSVPFTVRGFSAPATHRANVRGDTIVIRSLMTQPSRRPTLTKRAFARRHVQSIGKLIPQDAVLGLQVLDHTGELQVGGPAEQREQRVEQSHGQTVESSVFRSVSSFLHTAHGPAGSAILPSLSGIVEIPGENRGERLELFATASRQARDRIGRKKSRVLLTRRD